MSIPPIAKATLQAAVINAGSNVLAQGIKAYRDQVCSVFRIHVFQKLGTIARLKARGAKKPELHHYANPGKMLTTWNKDTIRGR